MWVRAFAVPPLALDDEKPGKERHVQKQGFAAERRTMFRGVGQAGSRKCSQG